MFKIDLIKIISFLQFLIYSKILFIFVKVLHVNFSDTVGGAAIAVSRIHASLLKEQIDSYLFVNEKQSNLRSVIGPSNTFKLIEVELRKSFSRFVKRKFIPDKYGTFSLNIIRSGISKKINNFNPDITHLHWIGNEMISISEIKKIKSPIIWTLHDMWPYTGTEHYTYDKKFIDGYNHTNTKKKFDINKWTWLRKKKNLNFPINFVATSLWQKENLKNSYLFKNQEINLIPLPLDTEKWVPIDKTIAKQILDLEKNKKTILIGSEGSHHFQRKGMDIIQDIFKKELINLDKIQVLVLGRNNLEIENVRSIKYFGYLNDEFTSLRLIYSASDLLLMPSRLESFGQMALEAGSCGTPTVSFEKTGTADIVKHKYSGYLSKYLDTKDFSYGVEWCLNNEKQADLTKNAREFVKENFDSKKIAKQYISLYESIIKK